MQPFWDCRTSLVVSSNNEGVDDVHLWGRACQGDGGAFAALFRRHRDRVFFFALRGMQSQHEAEDVTAIVFLELWRLRDRVRLVDGSIRPWLLVTANNVSRNQSRSRRRHGRLLQHLPQPEHEQDHATAILYEVSVGSVRRSVRDAFVQLSLKDQEILALCVLEELPVTTVSTLLGLPLGTTKSRLFRAKKQLERLLEAGGFTRTAIGS
jgi:RNA polymerase sigma factor (sigma-70 family)